MTPPRFLILALISAALVAEDSQADNLLVSEVPARWRLTWEHARIAGRETGTIGIHDDLLDVFASVPGLFAGIGGYAAVDGDNGGYFVVGVNLGWRAPITPYHTMIEIGQFIGAGGGRGDGYGGGLMLRPWLGIEQPCGAFALRSELGVVSFPTGDHESVVWAVGLDLPTDLVLAVPTTRPVTENAALAERPFRLTGWLEVLRPGAATRLTTGGPAPATIVLPGVELDSFCGEHVFVPLVGHAAAGSTTSGYMQVMSGLGYRRALGGPLRGEAALLIGSGGGRIDTGGGLLWQWRVGVGLQVQREWSLDAQLGEIRATDSRFTATTIAAGLSWTPTLIDPLAHDPGGVVVGPARARESRWRVMLSDKAYILPDDQRSTDGTASSRIIQLLGIGVHKPLSSAWELAADSYWAWQGHRVGSYAEAFAGPRFSLAPWAAYAGLRLFAQAELGVGGGGRMGVGSGVLCDLAAGAEAALTERQAIGLRLGRTTALGGGFAATVVSLEWLIRVGVPLSPHD